MPDAGLSVPGTFPCNLPSRHAEIDGFSEQSAALSRELPARRSAETSHHPVCIMNRMGDSGEGLIDAEARIAERMEEREQDRKRQQANARDKHLDPERRRRAESLRLARIELERQRGATEHAGRRQQLTQAMAELDKQLAALTSGD